MQTSSLHVNLAPRRVKAVIAGLVLAAALVLVGAGAFWEFYWGLEVPWDEAPPIKHMLVHFNLASENVPAVWFSSMLFLLVAVASALCFAADVRAGRQPSRSGRALKYGWLLFALVFFALSLDEVGSIHERVSVILSSNSALRSGGLGWASSLFVPVLAVALYLVAFGWLHVRRVRGTFVLMAVGVGCFLSIPLQEYVEIEVMYRVAAEGWRRPTALLLLEEGTEMAGALSFLAAALLYARRVAEIGAVPGQAPRHAVAWFPSPKVAVAVAAAFVTSMGLAMWVVPAIFDGVEGDAGIPRNWFPSALAALAAVFSFHLWDAARRRQRSCALAYLVATVVSVGASVYVGGYLYAYTSWGALDSVRLAAEGVSVAVILGTGLLLARRGRGAWGWAGAFGWALCLSAAVGPAGFSAVPPLVLLAFTFLLPTLLTHDPLWQPLSPLDEAGGR